MFNNPPVKEMKVRVVYVKCQQSPEIKEIPNTMTAFKSSVGGDIEYFPLGNYNSIYIICNEDGKLNSLDLNANIDGNHILGNFLVVKRNKNGDVISMSNSYAQKMAKLFILKDGAYRTFI